jgi:hypothetical protein
LLAAGLNAVTRVVAGIAVGPAGYFIPLAATTAIAIAAGATGWLVVG